MGDKLKIIYRAAADLKPYAKNARTHSEAQIAQIAASIQAFGWTNPVLVDEAGGIIAGHGRLEAALSLGMDEVPTLCIAGLSDVSRRALVLADNKLAMNAGWDADMLAAELDDLRGFGFDATLIGFTVDELNELIGTPNTGFDPDEVPPAPVVPVSLPGDLWLMGAHRLLCGDSTKAADVSRLMGGAKADMVFTDPPYGVDIQEMDMRQAEVRGRRKDGLGVANDNLKGDALRAFLGLAFGAALSETKPGACWYVCAPSGVDYLHPLNALSEIGIARHGIVWVKDRFVMGRCDYHYRHENIIYGWTPGAAHHEVPTRDQDSVWEFARPGRSPEHPTMKPVELVARAIRNSTDHGAAVLDLFSGSGTTAIASEQTGRAAFLMELDPVYADVSVTRWQTLTGKQATLDADGRTFDEVKRERTNANTRPEAQTDTPEAHQRQPRQARAAQGRSQAAAI